MKQYLDILKDIMENGNEEEAQGDVRTGVWAKRVFHREMIFDLAGGKVPFLSTKKVPVKGTIAEMLWIMNGRRKMSDLLKHNCKFWVKWPLQDFHNVLLASGTKEEALPDEKAFIDMIKHVCIDGKSTDNVHIDALLRQVDDMGPLYGFQWRSWNDYTFLTKTLKGEELFQENPGIDQLQTVVDAIKDKPFGRQASVMTSWNVSYINEMRLPPCHACHINHFVSDGKLSVKMVQRSCDMPVGVPINIAEYAVYLHIMCKITGLQPGTLIWSGDNVHIYNNQFEAVIEQLKRTPSEEMPTLIVPEISSLADLEDLSPDDFKLEGYDPQPAISFNVAV